jgi:transcriptional regulator with XRE-family HTH domain
MTRPPRATLGQQIKALREDMGLSQYELALQVGYGVRAIEHWEANMSLPDTESLILLSKTLHCKVLIVGEDNSVNLIRVPRESGTAGPGRNGHQRPLEDSS